LVAGPENGSRCQERRGQEMSVEDGRESRRRLPSRNYLETCFAAAQLGKTSSAFALDKGPQCLANKGALLDGPRQSLGLED